MSTYNSYGGSFLFGGAGDLLSLELGEYGSAVAEIEITACLRSASKVPMRTLEELYEQFHANLDRLPQVTFHRKKHRICIRFLSELFTDEDERGRSVEKCHQAAIEVWEALRLIRKRIKRDDDFDVDRFLRDAEELLTANSRSLEEWARIKDAAHAKFQAIQAQKDPWELLDIDWEQFHPQAREVLDDPFYWELVNDMAPNGSDTGADLLDDFRRWNKRNPNTAPTKFLSTLFHQWGIKPIDWHVTSPSKVRELNQSDPIALGVCNEAAVALAFAVIKLRATCPSDVVEIALAALDRTSLLVNESQLPDQIKSEWSVAVSKMRGKLSSAPQRD